MQLKSYTNNLFITIVLATHRNHQVQDAQLFIKGFL